LAGVAGLRMDVSGSVIGERPDIAQDMYIECTNIDRYRMHLKGDKAEVYKTCILKKYPFPEYDGEMFLTESVVWDRIAHDGYKLRWYNTPIYYCDYRETGLTKSGANSLRGHLNNYCGYLEHVRQSIAVLDPVEAVAVFRYYNYTAGKKGKSISQRAKDIEISTSSYLLYLIFKMPFYYFIKILIKVGVLPRNSLLAVGGNMQHRKV
ncbi:MAG: hypothetical protein IKF42_11660, partial [Mogibacterium sp.]|nr:hypothetical protein [Mogibacterium sp.]